MTRIRMRQMTDPQRYVKWKTFDEFIQSEWTIWKVTFIENDWKKSVCTCPVFQKENLCKHLLAIASKMKKLLFPNAVTVDEVPIGQLRPWGRPKGSTQALLL